MFVRLSGRSERSRRLRRVKTIFDPSGLQLGVLSQVSVRLVMDISVKLRILRPVPKRGPNSRKTIKDPSGE